jgi:probable HAF family extracellular repeat protein
MEATMKRISILVWILCAGLLSMAWAQPQGAIPPISRHTNLHRPVFNVFSKSFTTVDRGFNQQAAAAKQDAVYDLGHYEGGTWAESRGINDYGLVVGFGDIPSGYTRPVAVPLFGPTAGQWFDLGTLGGDRTDYEVMSMGVADTGMIVGHSAIQGDTYVHGFAWSPEGGMVDLGTLANRGHNFSLAAGVNKLGTLIVGWSSSEFAGQDSLPVVWTPKVVWGKKGSGIAWKIHKLDTKGFWKATYWWASSVNDSGQIVGTAVNPDGTEIGVLWNPLPDGKSWKIMQLPASPDYPNAGPNFINENGEIAGYLAAPDWSTWFPGLWEPQTGNPAYNLTRLTSLTGFEQGWAEATGMNDRGDIVGDSYDANGNDLATRWSKKKPNSIKQLGFPGTWSFASQVNNDRYAVGSYGSDTVLENVAVVQFH